MVGPTAVYSGDTPTSPIENHSQWEYAVPLVRDVSNMSLFDAFTP